MGGRNRLLFAALLLLLCVSACLQGARCSSREGGEGGSGGGGYVRNAAGGGGYFSGAAGGTISNWRDPLGQGALRVCGAALALAAAALL
uniref:Shadow of prion protein n=1 Tax=Setaria viridis TaxID=4556 RepID=A0A4U6TBR2_SETVI|nr:hypothetical protein SEVIR_8G049100v2 [Setaria viridis]